jgi:hypothetical protein
LPLFLLFLDYEKAYVRVDRCREWDILIEYGLSLNLENPIKSLYDNTNIIFNKENKDITGTSLKVNQGLRQGCGLSPILCDIYINKVLEEWKLTNPKSIHLGNNKYLHTILFADVQVLLAETEDHLHENVTKLNKILKLYNIRISANKIPAMAMEEKYMKRAKIVTDDIVTQQTSSFKCLGCNISIYKINMDLEDNVQKCNKLNGCIKRDLGKNMRKEN